LNLGEATKHRIVKWHLDGGREVITVAPKNVMALNRDIDIEITVWTAGETNFTLTGKLQSQTVFNTGRNTQVDGATSSNATLTAAVNARVWNNLTKTTTGSTWLRGDNIAKQRPNLALNLAGSSADIADRH
jgi:hypothetical protein